MSILNAAAVNEDVNIPTEGNLRPISAINKANSETNNAVDRLVVWTPAKDGEGAAVPPTPREGGVVGVTFDPDLVHIPPSEWRTPADRADTAPAVERFSTARYRPNDWHRFNYQTVIKSKDTQHSSVLTEAEARRCVAAAAERSEKDQRTSTRLLSERAHEVHGAQSELARSSWLCREEEELLELQRQRLMRAIAALSRPRAITSECLTRRHDRLEQDLVQDEPEIQLNKEMTLLDDVQKSLEAALASAEQQLATGRAARNRVEQDWGGKTTAGNLEADCLAISTARAQTALLYPACTRLPDGQSAPLHWESFTRNNLAIAEQERDASRRMREDIEQLLTSAARALRSQADVVEAAIERRIDELDECRQSLEDELKQILIRVSETERLITDLRTSIANHGIPLRVAHSRLDIRLGRPGLECCRDAPQAGLLNEVQRVEDTLSALRIRLAEAETTLAELLRMRNRLEHEIRIKRHSLTVDRTRCREIRLAFPSTVHLTGY